MSNQSMMDNACSFFAISSHAIAGHVSLQYIFLFFLVPGINYCPTISLYNYGSFPLLHWSAGIGADEK